MGLVLRLARTLAGLCAFPGLAAREDARRPLATSLREAALRPGHTSRRTGLTVLCQNFRFLV